MFNHNKDEKMYLKRYNNFSNSWKYVNGCYVNENSGKFLSKIKNTPSMENFIHSLKSRNYDNDPILLSWIKLSEEIDKCYDFHKKSKKIF